MRFIDPGQAVASGTLVLANDADVLAHAAAVQAAPAVALEFPKWTDGRAYSQAVLLRTRLGFTGELRATGEVLVDMLPLLARCGFDAVALCAGQDEAAAERALGFFAGHYQGDARRATAAAGPRFAQIDR